MRWDQPQMLERFTAKYPDFLQVDQGWIANLITSVTKPVLDIR